MSKPVILITGGAGYIGSHAVWALARAGYAPVVLDSLVNGHRWAVGDAPLEVGDVGDAPFVRAVCEKYRPAALMHFAAFIEVGESVKDPEKYIGNNFTKAQRLFETALEAGVTQAVFSSTAAVYGMPPRVAPITEDTPLAPINPYGESKLRAEQALRALGEKGMRSVSLRYFNAAGAAPEEAGIGEAHWPESHLIPRVILAALGLEPAIGIFGTDYATPDGTAVRDYIHVLDLIAAHVAALRYMMEGGATAACNLGTGQGYSVREVVDAVGRHLGAPVPQKTGPRREGDPPQLVADAALARRLLGWQPERGLTEIVQSALAWHRGARYRETVLLPRYGKAS
ncbi:MAG: UDP-glucose 4-epimerase GalE [Alphaproteobacteria bacterium]|nr:UDP-glucose 4-epimerase GalE [Alphaproteobacteria bacterium]